MPYSSHLGLTLALDHAVRLRPRRVLDIGFGLGKWGLLLREALDFMDGRVARESWQVTIDGIDARAHDSPLPAWVYDNVRIDDVLGVVDELEGYDLVVLGDVIEHFEKNDGLALLRSLLARNRNVLVTTPLVYFDQELDGNPFERHRSHWTMRDFMPWTFDFDVVGGFLIVALLAGRGAQDPRQSDKRASRIAYALPFLRRHGATARALKSLIRSH